MSHMPVLPLFNALLMSQNPKQRTVKWIERVVKRGQMYSLPERLFVDFINVLSRNMVEKPPITQSYRFRIPVWTF